MARNRRQQQNVTALVYDRKGRLLSTGRNSYIKTHPLMYEAGTAVNKPNSIYLHAEVAALVKIKDWSKAFRIDVVRYMKDGTTGNAKPCPICSRVISLTGIKTVNHT
jgi:deoxycytidylate deaminase